ncbi:DNA translocase FtsK 4TM domain-containing protein [Marivita sp. S6314]|uniref:DNA translocase FtsK n=1 Tax=Marivita sp. S6314 TaxID=2926406 RepID=UPI001FF5BF0B|nr:DNA translocase FtsK 4TM domain-containing protein [Marivita sp. S6314]MCK0149936.1 DNA translocase FtsK 4TM domain-containing protein [Marivita sp. S6314]
MAYQARGRDPLFDSNMQAAIEKRGKELAGFVLMALGAMAAMMIYSYSPQDPSWLSATDAPVQNWLGRPGASVAAPLFMIVGWASWGLALVLLVWGARFALHKGEERALTCLIFAPIWVALAAVYAAGVPESSAWTHSFGLGGLFGDMMMGSVLTILPLGTTLALKLMMVLLGGIVLVMGAFVLGFTRVELARLARFLLVGVIMVYATLLSLLGKGASGAVGAARQMQAKNAERRAIRAQEEAEAAEWAAAQDAVVAEPRVTRVAPPVASPVQPEDSFADAPEPQVQPQKTGFLAKMPSLIRRADPEPELVETYPGGELPEALPGDDRVRAKIADAIKTRVRQSTAVTSAAHAPLTKGRGRGPDPLIVPPKPALPPEPPVTARAAAPLRAEPPVTAQPQTVRTPAAPQMVDEPEENIFEDMADWDDYGDDAQAFTPTSPSPAPVPQPQAKKVVQQPTRKPLQPSKRAQQEAQPQLQFEDRDADYELPPLGLLMDPANIERHHLSDEALEENARMLEAVLDDYGVKGEIVSVRPGPVVTMYELEPAPGLKASRVIGLADDIARSMSALSARVSTVPGRSVIGIELPNENREMVSFREILSARDYGDGTQKLPLALGKDIGGDPVVANLAKMPHLLIAGTTGSGKSVAINTMILSLLYKLTPADLRLVMIDPKMLELSVYDGIPHLLSPVVTDPKKAVVALKWVVGEMEDRYRKMSKMGVRNIDGYNGRVADALARNEMFERTVQTGFDDETGEPIFETEEIQPVKMPYIVVIVDEMADLMMVAGKEIEACIQRLAQMARASGIHLIMATQRPSVDVITGTIKANFPTRISFQVTSKIDSRTILGEMGAEQLLGQGDMLYMAGGAKITRCHGPFVSDEEVEEIVTHLKAFGPPEYVSGVVQGPDDEKAENIDAVLGLNTGGNTDGEDALYDQAVGIVIRDRKCSTSYIQRKLAIGYNKAARLVEQMEDQGVVSAANHVGKREILVPEQ